MYITTIVNVLHDNSRLNLTAFFYLLIYVAALILPVLVITLAVDKGRGVFVISEAVRKRLPLIKLVNAAIFLIFGIIFVFS